MVEPTHLKHISPIRSFPQVKGPFFLAPDHLDIPKHHYILHLAAKPDHLHILHLDRAHPPRLSASLSILQLPSTGWPPWSQLFSSILHHSSSSFSNAWGSSFLLLPLWTTSAVRKTSLFARPWARPGPAVLRSCGPAVLPLPRFTSRLLDFSIFPKWRFFEAPSAPFRTLRYFHLFLWAWHWKVTWTGFPESWVTLQWSWSPLLYRDSLGLT